MGVADLQVDIPSLQGCPVADAGDVQRLLKPFCHARYGVVDQGSRKTVHRPVLGCVRGPLDYYVTVLLPNLDPWRGQRGAFGPLTFTLRPESSTLTAPGI